MDPEFHSFPNSQHFALSYFPNDSILVLTVKIPYGFSSEIQLFTSFLGEASGFYHMTAKSILLAFSLIAS